MNFASVEDMRVILEFVFYGLALVGAAFFIAAVVYFIDRLFCAIYPQPMPKDTYGKK